MQDCCGIAAEGVVESLLPAHIASRRRLKGHSVVKAEVFTPSDQLSFEHGLHRVRRQPDHRFLASHNCRAATGVTDEPLNNMEAFIVLASADGRVNCLAERTMCCGSVAGHSVAMTQTSATT
jgi:hypothetical protein